MRGGKRRGPFERDLIELDNGLKKRDTPYIYLQSASLYQALAAYVNVPKNSHFVVTCSESSETQPNSDNVFPSVLPAGEGYIRLVTVILRPNKPPSSSTRTTTSDSQSLSGNTPFVQPVSTAMSSDYEYSDDDGDYYDDELMEEDQGKCRLTASSATIHSNLPSSRFRPIRRGDGH